MIFVLSLLFFWKIESAEFAKKHIMIYNNKQCFVGLMQLGKEAVCYMIGYLNGKISHLLIDYCLINVNGVGYRVFIAGSTRAKLSVGSTVTLFTYLNVREDAMLLYGFYTQAEYDLFLKLLSVSGIGPKVALGMMSAITVENLSKAIQQKQIGVLTKLPGIGKKSAERLILELKDKVQTADDIVMFDVIDTGHGGTDVISEASQALFALGYTQAEITPLLRKAMDFKTVEDVIKFALKEFARR